MRYLIYFESLLVTVCAFVAWYVQSPIQNDMITIGLLWLLILSIIALVTIWIYLVWVVFFKRYSSRTK